MSVVNGMVTGMRRGSATGTPKARSGAKSRQEGARIISERHARA